MGNSSQKSYKYSPTGNQQCGQLVTVVGVMLAAVAAFLDRLTGIYKDDDADTPLGYCGWNTWGLWVDEDGIYGASYFEYYCSGDGKDSLIYDDDDMCETQTEGGLWLAFVIIALLLSVSAIGTIQFNYDKSSKCSNWAATACGIIAVVCWVVNNPICYDDDDVDDEIQRLGSSAYLMIAASVCWLIGGFIS